MADPKIVPAQVAPVPEPARLVNAGESTDPTVHRLIAELHSAWQNEDRSAIERITRALAELGYQA